MDIFSKASEVLVHFFLIWEMFKVGSLELESIGQLFGY